ncbi:IclR family transcriptional regulator [Acidiphilium sp. AL]|uniref:IclR family transcriptional regulator n=1 Tax=Acidiphilium sp. AL TaxID=2871704 RepID=UPI0021CB75DB|nr:IclR family transcriptional regulator [Acidiphilium sp. AL]MCU4161823.1 IclR family transcriptional regulator [Acidiphilium sp. AL]
MVKSENRQAAARGSNRQRDFLDALPADVSDISGKRVLALSSMKPFAFLEAVAHAGRPLGILEFGALLNIPQPTAHRIVHMLIEEGLLAREPGTRRYGPGNRLAKMGISLLIASVRSAPRRAILEELSKTLEETCNFGVLSGNNLVYLDRVEAAWPFGLRFEPGSRVPLHCTSMGKLFLSFLPSEKRRRVLGKGPLYRYTPNTIIELPDLEQEFEKIRASGISTDNQEFLAGVVCVAVPIREPNGNVVAAIAVSAPAARMSLDRGLEHVPLLFEAAHRIEGTFWDEPPLDRQNKPKPRAKIKK